VTSPLTEDHVTVTVDVATLIKYARSVRITGKGEGVVLIQDLIARLTDALEAAQEARRD